MSDTKPDDLGPLPTIHPRHFEVEDGRQILAAAVLELHKRNLTPSEVMGLLADAQATIAWRCVRYERRGDSDEEREPSVPDSQADG